MSDSFGNTNDKRSAGDNSSPEEHATTMRPSIKEHRELLVAFFILAVPACAYPLLSNSSYKSSADFHAAIETTGAILGLIAGFALIAQFNLLRNRFYLFIGLAFLVNGAGDLIQGLLSFAKLYGIAGLHISSVDRFVPATHVAGRQIMQKAMQGQTVRLENIPYLLPNGKYGLTTETFIPLRAEPETENENTFTSILPKQERRIADAQRKAHIAC